MARVNACPYDSPWSALCHPCGPRPPAGDPGLRAEHGAPDEWAGVSDAGEPDAAGTDAEGFGGAVGEVGANLVAAPCGLATAFGRVEEDMARLKPGHIRVWGSGLAKAASGKGI